MAAANKQSALDRLTNLIGVPPMDLGPGSTIPSALFDALLEHFGLPTGGSMPIRGRRLVEFAGLRWEETCDSRSTPSGGGSTVTLTGLSAMEDAVRILLGRQGGQGVEERNRLLDAGEKYLAANGQFDPESIEDARQRVMTTIVARRGQERFRQSLLDTYDHRCAVTGTQGDWVLEAAHIIPYRGSQTNVISNGLLLRSDIHTLFDCGLVGVRHDYTIVTATELQPTVYGALEGEMVRLPADRAAWPFLEALECHRNRFGLRG